MAKSIKLLVCGDVKGHFNQIYQRVNTIQKKSGVFDMLLCVGDFFGDDNEEWDQYKNATNKVPIATFILGPTKTEHIRFLTDISGCELCENVTYLGRRGLYTTSSGLSVVYLSGVEDASTSSSCSFNSSDVDTLRRQLTEDVSFQGVDLLLTSQWPCGIDKYATPADMVDSSIVGSALISQLALSIKPRYHFCGRQGVSYERLPYRNHKVLMQSAQHVTRFIALADVGNEQKHKYMYAFNIVPMKHIDVVELVKQPPDVTECPYKRDMSVLQSTTAKDTKPDQFFYDSKSLERGAMSQRGKKRFQDSPHGGAPHHKRPAQPTGPCWFCLGSPEVEKHLVVSVGTECYLALAKGGLTPDHILITPIGHHQSTTSAPTDVLDELNNYKSALRKCYQQSSMSVVFFERNYRTQHLQIQCVPVPTALSSKLKDTFMQCGQSVELSEIPSHSDLKQIVRDGAPYFYAELPHGERLLCQITHGFPLQFGREVLAHASLLNMPDRVDWKSCQFGREAELKMAADFRQRFQPYDFTLT